MNTIIHKLKVLNSNHIWIKREDLLPYSFGGNKARKAKLFFESIDAGEYDCVVTYGSSHSNHCRIVANMAAMRNMACFVISPLEVSEQTYNSKFMDIFGAKIIHVPVEEVHDTIENKIVELQAQGHIPFFIPGGGHGNIGTQAYVECYQEILNYEQENNIHFDYIFHASGTGTTQAGLVCGQLMNEDERQIVGLSIARKNPRGRDVVIDSICEYLREKKIEIADAKIQEKTIFVDDYIGDGYGKENELIYKTIKKSMLQYGVPLDSTYTGKAFWGMGEFIKKMKIQDKDLLFIHTGGTPLFFDDLKDF